MSKTKKLIFKRICFEITRKCNMKCPHCMRGESQDKTITKEVIDKALDAVGIAYSLILTGGEPFLEPEMIEYLFDEIIRREIPIHDFSCVTNGSVRDVRIAESWNRLSEYVANRYEPTDDAEADRKYLRAIGQITVSDDKYHKLDCEPFDTVKWYRQYLNKNCIIRKETHGKDYKDNVHILGRAAKQDFNEFDTVYYPVCPYKIEIEADGKIVSTCIQIGHDGKLTIGEDSSYEQQDKYNYGNILDSDSEVFELLKKGIYLEPFTQKEAYNYNLVYTAKKTKVYPDDWTEELVETLLHYFDTMYTARKVCMQMFPWLTYEQMIETVYDDLNVNLRETNDKPYLKKLEDLEDYNVSIEESIKRIHTVKLKALLVDPFTFLKNQKLLGSQIQNDYIKIWDETENE